MRVPRGGKGGLAGLRLFSWRLRRHRRRRVVELALLLIVVVVIGGNMAWSAFTSDLPSILDFGTNSLSQVTRIYASDGTTLLEARYRENRTVVPLSSVSHDLQDATIAVEDRDFYSHGSVDIPRLAGAALYDIQHGEAAQGASTITMQTVKATVLPPRIGEPRALDWKIKQLILASQLESHYSKAQILEMYLNSIYYGRGAYGIEAAAQTYFKRGASDLSLPEASFLAGLPQSPARYDSATTEGFAAAKARQQNVLDAMVTAGKASRNAADKALSTDLGPQIRAPQAPPQPGRVSAAPHFVDYVLDQLRQQYGDEVIARGGLNVVTTLSPRAQQQAVKATQDQVAAVAGATSTGTDSSDGQPAYGPNNGAMLVIAPQTGAILAMVGSRDYNDPTINGARNMAVDEPRQVGSSFKPYTYATALANGYAPNSILEDDNPNFSGDPDYHPHDFDNRQMGRITLATSLQQSRNISSVHLFESLGAYHVFATAQSLGVPPEYLKSPGLSATLGTNEMRMIDHVAAYGGFAAGGRRVQPWAIVKVTDGTGKVIEDKTPRAAVQAIPSDVAGTLTSILKGAVPPYYGLDLPVAGKSGTTEHWTDSWFLGYTTDLVVGAWMGHTDEHSAHLHMNVVYGENGAGLMMRDFFKSWYSEGKPADFPPVAIRPCTSRVGSEQPPSNAQAPPPAPASPSEPTAPYEFAPPGSVPAVAPTWEPRGPYVPHPAISAVPCAGFGPHPSPSPTQTPAHPDDRPARPPSPAPLPSPSYPPIYSPYPNPSPTCTVLGGCH